MGSCLPARCLRRSVSQNALISFGNFLCRRAALVYGRPYFQVVRHTAELALPNENIDRFLRNHLSFLIYFYLEMLKLIEQPAPVLKQKLAAQLTKDLGPLSRVIESGSPALVPIIQLNLNLRLLFADLPVNGTQFRMIGHRRIPETQTILDKADPNWGFIFVEDSGKAETIRNAFAAGQVVVCNIDYSFPNTEVTLARVLGRPAIVPSGIFRLAHRMSVPIVPLIVSDQEGSVRLHAPETIHWDAFAGEALPVAAMLAHLQTHFDNAIRQSPEQWLGWGNLLHRWTAWQQARTS